MKAITEYFIHNYAQLGAGYSRSQRATKVVADAHSWLEVFMNTAGRGQVSPEPARPALFRTVYGHTSL